MFTVKIDDKEVLDMLKRFPREAGRAAERAIDETAVAIKTAVRAELPKVFDRPTPYTLNSLQVRKTQGHDLVAWVWFKKPERMSQHYLVPQVIGGGRPTKGYERALDGSYMIPSRRAKHDRYGNLPYGTIVQILSVLGKAERLSGSSANITERSKWRNRKSRDYVWIKTRHGKLPPGVYQRVQTGVGFGAKTKRTLPFGEWQQGRKRGQFASVIRARGLKPILIEQRAPGYRKRLPFFDIGRQVMQRELSTRFFRYLAQARR